MMRAALSKRWTEPLWVADRYGSISQKTDQVAEAVALARVDTGLAGSVAVAGQNHYGGGKRQKERQRAEKKAEKESRRRDRAAKKSSSDAAPGVDPDIAHIVPGPQPVKDDDAVEDGESPPPAP